MDDIDKLKHTLGAALGEARRRAGLTQEAVAARTGLAPDIYGRIERGSMWPSVPMLHRLCVLLHVSVNGLWGLGHAPPPPPGAPAPAEDSPELASLAHLLCSLPPQQMRSLLRLATLVAHPSHGQDDEPPGQ